MNQASRDKFKAYAVLCLELNTLEAYIEQCTSAQAAAREQYEFAYAVKLEELHTLVKSMPGRLSLDEGV